MKTNIYKLFVLLFATLAIVSCKDDEGTDPGNDSNPVITIYEYSVLPPLDSDTDLQLKFAVNNKVESAYYFAEATVDKNARVASLGVNGYNEYVIANGTKLVGITTDSLVSVISNNMKGEYTITAVAVGSGKITSAETNFHGINWVDVTTGTYKFWRPAAAGDQVSTTTTLQIDKADNKSFRFKDLSGVGYSLKINLVDKTATDGTGTYTFLRVPAAKTGFTYGTYGSVYFRDYGYWKGSDSYALTAGAYESGMYANYECFLNVQYYVSAGNLGSGVDTFMPN